MRRELSGTGERCVAKAMALPILLLTVLACSAGDQARSAKQNHVADSFRLSVDVSLVVLHATEESSSQKFLPQRRKNLHLRAAP
jgi:outer membrane lipopolysaccharide assembly protein LptE/RlpB